MWLIFLLFDSITIGLYTVTQNVAFPTLFVLSNQNYD